MDTDPRRVPPYPPTFGHGTYELFSSHQRTNASPAGRRNGQTSLGRSPPRCASLEPWRTWERQVRPGAPTSHLAPTAGGGQEGVRCGRALPRLIWLGRCSPHRKQWERPSDV
eukprot:4126698-Pyramimonas_sp.AAC.1